MREATKNSPPPLILIFAILSFHYAGGGGDPLPSCASVRRRREYKNEQDYNRMRRTEKRGLEQNTFRRRRE